MATINDATRMCKRIMLTNLLTNDYSIALTPLLSGKHGIGKSQVAKRIAEDIGGISITIEGGTLKEGEITGIPYQYRNENDEIEFRFLPYYVVKRIQEAEKELAKDRNIEKGIREILNGSENMYSEQDLSFERKVEMIENHEVVPVVIFFDEINRTDMSVFRELMNIILTRSVNGYRFPWWVFIMAAMNPASQNSIYITNEMDPAQLDRFIKIKVRESANEWLDYAIDHNVDRTLMEFIANHSQALSGSSQELDDTDKPMASPRGWNMVDLLIKGKDRLDMFFNKKDLSQLDADLRAMISAKVGSEAAIMYFTSLKDNTKLIMAEDLFDTSCDGISVECADAIKAQSTARDSITTKSIIQYLKKNICEIISNKSTREKITKILKEYSALLDASSRLLFAVSVSNAKSDEGIDIFSSVYEIFDDNLIELLQENNLNEMRISEGA